MSAPHPPAPSPTLASQVAAAIGDMIREDHLAPGHALPSETALGEQFGVSRTVIREALGALAALRLIDIGSGRRAQVAAIDHSVLALMLDHAVHIDQISIQQIYDARRTIELRTTALAALRRSDLEADLLRSLAASMRRDAARPPAVMEHDIAFHEAIAAASRNPMLSLLVRSFHRVTRQTWPIGWASRRHDSERLASVACHEAIAAAILARDVAAAEAAMAEHFDLSVRALLAAGIV